MTTTLETILRRTAAVSVAAGALMLLAGPAQADVPEGWAEHTDVNGLHALLILAGIPLLLFLVITALVYVPALIRGERVAPGSPSVEDQWFGGPRKGTSALPAPDTDESKAGGASGRW